MISRAVSPTACPAPFSPSAAKLRRSSRARGECHGGAPKVMDSRRRRGSVAALLSKQAWGAVCFWVHPATPSDKAMAMKLKDSGLLRTQAYINGEWVGAAKGASHPVKNPATGEQLGTVPDMGAAETRRAIEAAAQAFPAWAARTAKDRAAILRRWFDLMMANQEDLAQLMTAEQGKP